MSTPIASTTFTIKKTIWSPAFEELRCEDISKEEISHQPVGCWTSLICLGSFLDSKIFNHFMTLSVKDMQLMKMVKNNHHAQTHLLPVQELHCHKGMNPTFVGYNQRFEISVNQGISVFRFYGYIRNIEETSMNILTKNIDIT